ncbi:alpha/beta hydrolase [Actinomadura livida]|uniref:Acetyl esterase/lipase n=1 Tax=Actinomadura livida TaxID=79909 RepID=A0A7W7IFD7_9ACTN|nr:MULTISPECIES: alpha/beta hydrolase [Actinomadura]MBB4776113.1 acetyl esterase/lipase [Actinomadura catellatispora]GGU15406.1 esterase [Actinomadura livida]
MTYAYDPELVPWISTIPQIVISEYEQIRRDEVEMFGKPQYVPPIPVDVRDVHVPGPEGAPDVPVRIYAPADRDGDLPGLVHIHAGGFVIGSIDTAQDDATSIAAEVGAVVLSVGYRLAPEHPFPAGLDDCYAVLTWAAAHSAELGIDPGRLAVGGDSAGGGLSAAVALMARDRGGPALCFQLLGIPELDDRLDTPSMRAFTDTPIWHRRNAELSWDYYLGEGVRGTDSVSPYAAPARAEDLSGLPPAYVTTCEFDPLRDEGLTYAQRLIQAGVPTELHHYPGTFHGSTMIRDAAITKRMRTDRLTTLQHALTQAST